jgi:hypothetical protein
VTALKVNHDDTDAFGFGIDNQGHSLPLSGDTQLWENLVGLGFVSVDRTCRATL